MADITNGIKSVASIGLVDKDTNIVIALQTTKDVVFNPGFEQEVVYALSELGIEQPVRQNLTREDPTIQVTFPRKNLDALGLALNRKFEQAGASTPVDVELVRQFSIRANSYPAVTSGTEGFGIVEDIAGAKASANIDGVSEELTLGTFATFNAATATKSFAVGDNGALKFSNDLVNPSNPVPVALIIPYTIDGIFYLGEAPYSNLALTISFIMDDLRIIQMQFARAAVSLDNNSINFAEGGVQTTFRSIFDGSQCTAYSLKVTGLSRKCAV